MPGLLRFACIFSIVLKKAAFLRCETKQGVYHCLRFAPCRFLAATPFVNKRQQTPVRLYSNSAKAPMLTQALKQDIQQAYSRFLDSKGLKPRYGQKLMIAEIARTLGGIETDAEGNRTNQAGLCAIEAGTGTGKTVAYTLAVLPVARALGKKVVISTATITLQEQIIYRDLPDVLRHSGLSFRFALAKGRGRYLCLSKLDQKLQQSSMQENLFGTEEPSRTDNKDSSLALYESMAKALLTNGWDGDRDSWPEPLDDELWQPMTADRNQCAGRRCQHVAQCSFIKARDNLGSVDCVVANHDLVMADLALGGGAILPAPDETIYIFDEAHHLPDIALRHFTGQLRVHGCLHWTDQSIKQLQDTNKAFARFVELLDKLAVLPSILLELKQCYTQLKPLVEQLVEHLHEALPEQLGQLPHFRFEHGQIPEPLAQLATEFIRRFQPLLDDLSAAHDLVAATLDSNQTGYSLNQLELLYADLGMMLNSAERQYGLWQAYSKTFDDLPDSRWIQLVESGGFLDYELAASPLLAAETLNRYLWHSCYGAVLTSATLTALGEFRRLRMHSGLPGFAHTAVVPSPFNYGEKARFVVPPLQFEPSHQQHSEEVVSQLEQLVEGHTGVLVLFASRRQMDEVYEQLPRGLQEKVLCQTHMSRQKLLESHTARVDAGQQSVLFGMASLAEGVDLPGKYCTHVIIAKLPFAVPSDPVGAALDEWLKAKGRNAFVEVSLPEVSQKLVQACGRLIRSEEDSGQITLLDKRILTKHYGRQLLSTLPPFQQILAKG